MKVIERIISDRQPVYLLADDDDRAVNRDAAIRPIIYSFTLKRAAASDRCNPDAANKSEQGARIDTDR